MRELTDEEVDRLYEAFMSGAQGLGGIRAVIAEHETMRAPEFTPTTLPRRGTMPDGETILHWDADFDGGYSVSRHSPTGVNLGWFHVDALPASVTWHDPPHETAPDPIADALRKAFDALKWEWMPEDIERVAQAVRAAMTDEQPKGLIE